MASMNYLALCQYTHRLAKAGNAQAGSQPAAIPVPTQQDQIVYDIVDAVPRAWEWVQNEHPSWNFMRKEGAFNLTAGQRTYTLAQIQAQISDYYGFIPMWGGNSPGPYYFLCDPAQTPQVLDYPMRFVEYMDFRGIYDRRPRPQNFQPTILTEWPDKTLECDPAPNLGPSGGQWQLRFDYRRTNQVLSAQTDVPILPPEFHELIAYVALRMVCEIRMDTGQKYVTALRAIDDYLSRLKARYLPIITVDSQLA